MRWANLDFSPYDSGFVVAVRFADVVPKEPKSTTQIVIEPLNP
jgi:hypothetical protein